MVHSKKRTVVTLVKVRHDGQLRIKRAYRQLWRWVLEEEKEIKSNQEERKE